MKPFSDVDRDDLLARIADDFQHVRVIENYARPFSFNQFKSNVFNLRKSLDKKSLGVIDLVGFSTNLFKDYNFKTGGLGLLTPKHWNFSKDVVYDATALSNNGTSNIILYNNIGSNKLLIASNNDLVDFQQLAPSISQKYSSSLDNTAYDFFKKVG